MKSHNEVLEDWAEAVVVTEFGGEIWGGGQFLNFEKSHPMLCINKQHCTPN